MVEGQRAGIGAAKVNGAYKGPKRSIDRNAVKRLREDGVGATQIARLRAPRDWPSQRLRGAGGRVTAPPRGRGVKVGAVAEASASTDESPGKF